MKVTDLPHLPRQSRLKLSNGTVVRFLEYYAHNQTVMYVDKDTLIHTSVKRLMGAKPKTTKALAAILAQRSSR